MRRKTSFFDVLGVTPEDDAGKIRQAWRRKVKTLHPDIAKDKDRSGKLLAQVNAAFDELKSHTPFAERRRGDRRKTWRSTRIWSASERAHKRAVARQARQRDQQAGCEAAKRKALVEKQQRREQAKAFARRKAAELARQEAAARARRAMRKRAFSTQEVEAHMAANLGYANARQAMSAL
ncbi:MAG: J domain-containing protein [Litoreibacter sp.]|nr:J domain-containing protein [Litoreibacter sp.]